MGVRARADAKSVMMWRIVNQLSFVILSGASGKFKQHQGEGLNRNGDENNNDADDALPTQRGGGERSNK